jgi:hypothetical protein
MDMAARGAVSPCFLPEDFMQEIVLTRGRVAIVDDEDYDFLKQWKWHCISSRSNVYAGRKDWDAGSKKQKTIMMHRIIAGALPGEFVDHINRDTIDNRRSNLRICNQSQNSANSVGHAIRASRFKGVYKSRNRWKSCITKDGLYIYLGSFGDEETAARAYDSKAIELFGEFAKTNFPTCAND